MLKRSRFVTLIAISLLAGACGEPATARSGTSVALAEAVSGNAAGAIGSDGRFVQKHPDKFGQDDLMAPEEAARLADRYVTEYGPSMQGYWSSFTTEQLQARVLRRCGPAQYIEAAYQPLDATVSFMARKAYGPRYSVPFCDGSGIKVLIGVSAVATDLRVVSGALGPISDLFVAVVGRGVRSDDGFPTSPEAAARVIAELTGRRVREVPYAVGHPLGDRLTTGLWFTQLEAPQRFAKLSNGVGEVLTDSVVLGRDERGRTVLLSGGADASEFTEMLTDDPGSANGRGQLRLRVAEVMNVRRSRIRSAP